MDIEQIKRIHSIHNPILYVVAGGGFSAVNDLLSVAGASKTIWEARVIYNEASMESLVGYRGFAVSEQTAQSMAYSLRYQIKDSKLPVISCTAAIKTNRERRGEDRAWIAVYESGSDDPKTELLTLDKNLTRSEQEKLISERIVYWTEYLKGIK